MKARLFTVVFSIALLSLSATSVFAQKGMGKDLQNAVKRVNSASEVINEIMRGGGDKSIPRDLLQKAKAVVVFPGSIKGAFIVGGQGGKGIAIRRFGRNWTAPAFLNMGGGSFGLQAGGSKIDYVMLVMNDKGVRNLLADKFEIGGEASVAAGPVGRTTAASTNITLDAEILTWSRSQGAFAGISLKGVTITNDEDLNKALYQKSAKQVLSDPPILASAAPAALQKFSQTVDVYAH